MLYKRCSKTIVNCLIKLPTGSAICTRKLRLSNSLLCTGPSRRYLFSQECFYSWAWRWDSHFHSNNCVQWGWPGAYGVQDQWSSGERIILLSPSASVSLDCSRALCIQVHPGESWFPRNADKVLQTHRMDTLQPEIAKPSYTRDNHMAKANLTNRN